MNKQCGTCKWWVRNSELATSMGQDIGDCNWDFKFPDLLPESSVYNAFNTYCMLEDEGQDCPTYEER